MPNSLSSNNTSEQNFTELKLDIDYTKSKLPVLLYFWQVPDRVPYKEPAYMKSIIALISLVSGLYFWWAGQILMTLLSVAFFYLYYLIVSIKPIKVTHVIYSNGIRTLGEFYPWDNLVYFWVGMRDGWYVVYVKTTLKLPKVLIMLADNKEEAENLVLILGQFLPYRPIPKKQNFWDQNMYGTYQMISDIVDTELLYDTEKLKEKIEKIVKLANKNYKKQANALKNEVNK